MSLCSRALRTASRSHGRVLTPLASHHSIGRLPTHAPQSQSRTSPATALRQLSSWSDFKDNIKMRLGVPGKKFVGEDAKGNTYYIVQQHQDDIPRRVVDYVDEFPDSNSIPRLWYSWLRHTIEDAPTEEECLADLQVIATMAARVKMINEKDEKLRMQEMAERRASGETEAPDMSVKEMLGQLEKAAKP